VKLVVMQSPEEQGGSCSASVTAAVDKVIG